MGHPTRRTGDGRIGLRPQPRGAETDHKTEREITDASHECRPPWQRRKQSSQHEPLPWLIQAEEARSSEAFDLEPTGPRGWPQHPTSCRGHRVSASRRRIGGDDIQNTVLATRAMLDRCGGPVTL